MSEEERRAAIAGIEQRGGRLKSTEQGAPTSVWCATSPRLEGMGGVYCEDCDVAEAVGPDPNAPRGVRPWAIDREAAEKLWAASERWTGVTWPPA